MAKVVKQAFADYCVPLSETVTELPVPKGTEVLVASATAAYCIGSASAHGYFDLGAGKNSSCGRATPPFTLGPNEVRRTVLTERRRIDGGRVYLDRLRPWVSLPAGRRHLCANRADRLQVDGRLRQHVLVRSPRPAPYDPIPPGRRHILSRAHRLLSIAKLGPYPSSTLFSSGSAVGVDGADFRLPHESPPRRRHRAKRGTPIRAVPPGNRSKRSQCAEAVFAAQAAEVAGAGISPGPNLPPSHSARSGKGGRLVTRA